MAESLGLGAEAVADLGAGTGIFTEQLLRRGYLVYAVEPNDAMREAMTARLAKHLGFHAVAAGAEATGLPPECVDAVTAAQAFHWFDAVSVRAECLRILKPGGYAFLLWNERLVEGDFLGGYEALIQSYSDDYAQVDHRNTTEQRIAGFYGGGHYHLRTFPNTQAFDWAGLAGRTRSCSYVPAPGHPNHEPLMRRLRKLFDKHEVGGQVHFEYRCRLYAGVVQ